MNPSASTSTAAEFAARHLAVLPQLSTQENFPAALWAEMGKVGLLGSYLPKKYGGGESTSANLQQAGEVFVRTGGNLGLATAWFSHCQVARFFFGCFGTAAQLEEWMPEFAAGRATASVAISEPGAGAHPKHLNAKAERTGDTYCLSGEKFHVTNGNIAHLFVVLAITNSGGGRKHYSAFLVPRETAGLDVETMPPLDYLRPCQHVRLKMNGCAVPWKNLLGPKDGAFEAMALPFRDVEDMLGAGPLLGAMGRQLDALLNGLRERGGSTTAEAEESLGELDIRLAGCRVLAAEGAKLLDAEFSAGTKSTGTKSAAPAGAEAGYFSIDTRQLARLSMAARTAMREFQGAVKKAAAACGGGENPALAAMTHELSRVAGGPGKVAQLKRRKLGADLLDRAE